MIKVIDTLYGVVESVAPDGRYLARFVSMLNGAPFTATIPVERLSGYGLGPGDRFKITLTKKDDARIVATYAKVDPADLSKADLRRIQDEAVDLIKEAFGV